VPVDPRETDMAPHATPVSACIITLNEEHAFPRCLASVRWADEIVVVDSGSTDRTIEIAEEAGARVIHNDWPGFAAQKQFAVDNASHNWVLSLDADEWLDEQLTKEIQRVIAGSPDENVCYSMNRMSWYFGRWIQHGTWYPDWLVRLYHRQHGRWGGGLVHEGVKSHGRVQRLAGNLLHEPFSSVSDHLQRLDKYTTLWAGTRSESSRRQASVYRATLRAAFAWFRSYILRRGLLDGGPGLLCSGLIAFDTFVKYAKLWERQSEAAVPANGDATAIKKVA